MVLVKPNGVIAVFVKTPELSRVKTRLAAGIGENNSLLFYNKALEATSAIVKQVKMELTNVDIVWAVTEEQGLKSDRWKDFPTVYQGAGDLGQKLHTVYSKLLSKYSYVAFMGADSPHISYHEIVNALSLTQRLRHEKFIIGETHDGGFYFFGGGKEIPKEVWLNVEYSTEQTGNQLINQLQKYGDIEKLSKNFDIDTIEDFRNLGKCADCMLPEQAKLIKWARSLL